MSQLSRDQLGDAFNVLTDRVKEGMMAQMCIRDSMLHGLSPDMVSG